MAARARTVVYFEDPDDYLFPAVVSVPGMVSVLWTPGVEFQFLGPTADHDFELLLNRLRMQHAVQVERRDEP